MNIKVKVKVTTNEKSISIEERIDDKQSNIISNECIVEKKPLYSKQIDKEVNSDNKKTYNKKTYNKISKLFSFANKIIENRSNRL
jgi:hypothetical protein